MYQMPDAMRRPRRMPQSPSMKQSDQQQYSFGGMQGTQQPQNMYAQVGSHGPNSFGSFNRYGNSQHAEYSHSYSGQPPGPGKQMPYKPGGGYTGVRPQGPNTFWQNGMPPWMQQGGGRPPMMPGLPGMGGPGGYMSQDMLRNFYQQYGMPGVRTLKARRRRSYAY